jgi:dephospho-CoA kinase
MRDRASTPKSQVRIGLTGGISTGKTTVSRYLSEVYQWPILDADLYARGAVQPGSPVLQEIVRRYGQGILLPDRALNRKQLGEIIFNHPEEKRWVEAQIHPYVRDRFLAELQPLTDPIVVLAIPLLFESQMTDLVNQIWVVSCSPQQQLERLMARDRLSPEQARSRIHSQMPLAQKIAAADIVFDNSSTVEALLEQVDRAIAQL